MAVNDIYRLKVNQSYELGGQICLNVFYYKQVTPQVSGVPSQVLANAFEAEVAPGIRGVQTNSIIWLSLEVANIIPSSDFFTLPYTGVEGDRVGETLPPTNCYSFRLNRASGASRNGQKRIVGVREEDQSNGVAAPSVTTALGSLANLLDNIIGGPPPAVATFQPIIFRPGRPAQTIPEKTIPAVFQADFDIASAEYVSIGTQNTRKFGAGS